MMTRESIDQLKDAKKKVKLVEKMTSVLKDSLKTEITDLNDSTLKEIDSLLNVFTEVKEVKGIVRDPAKYSGIIRTPGRYLRSAWGIPGENALNTIKTAQTKAQDLIDGVNNFVAEDWEAYTERINAIDFEWFEKMEKVEIKE